MSQKRYARPKRERTHGEHEEYEGKEPERRRLGTAQGQKGQDSIGGCCTWTKRARTDWWLGRSLVSRYAYSHESYRKTNQEKLSSFARWQI
jgi:hypothetical protein